MAEEDNKLYPKSRLAEEIALADYASTLPLPVDFGTHQPYSMAGGQEVASRLFGTQGQERFQLWPERMVRSAVSAPYEALSGSFGPPGSRETTERMLEPAIDIAGLAVTGPLAMKPGTASVGSGMTRMGKASEAAVEHAPAFYSAVENAVKGAKQEKATAEQWLGFLKNQPGVKPEELAWTIKDLPSGQVTKKQLEDHIAANKVEVKEVVKADKPFNFDTQFEDKVTGTKYSKYQLPGGENYKELLLTLPEKENVKAEAIYDKMSKYYNQPNGVLTPEFKKLKTEYDNLQQKPYKSSHWDEPNILAHIRMNDRTINGKKTLHIEEIQSDWHQAGRKSGYKGELTPELKNQGEQIFKKIEDHPDKNLVEKVITHGSEEEAVKLAVANKMITQEEGNTFLKYTKAESGQSLGVPDAPFKKTWDELALKKVIRHAAENGYDAISWTPGEAQAARYDLSKQVEAIRVNKNPDGTYQLGVKPIGHNMQKHDTSVPANKLSELIGKELAERVTKEVTEAGVDKGKVFEGLDLKVGGEGMKAFYDKMLVDKANALGKKFGSKVEQVELKNNKEPEYYVDQARNGIYKVVDVDGNLVTDQTFKTMDEAGQWLMKDAASKKSNQPIHTMQITPEMKQQVLGKGFPLFSAGVPTLSPVDYDPFRKDQQMKNLIEQRRQEGEKPTAPGGKSPSTGTRDVKLVPVDFNPFTNPNAI